MSKHIWKKTMVRFASMVLFSLTLQIGFGQKFFFKNFSIDHGLAQSQVHDLCEDRFGFLWLSTANGISRFDGKSFQNFTEKDGLLGNLVLTANLGSDGRMIFLTQRGVSVFDGQMFKNFELCPSPPCDGSSKALVSDFAVNTYSDKSGLFFLVNGSIVVNYLNEHLAYLPLPSKTAGKVTSMHCTPDGKLVIAADHALFQLRDDGLWSKILDTGEGESATAMRFSKTDTLLAIGPKLFQWRHHKLSEIKLDDADETITFIVEDRNKTLWLARHQSVYHLANPSISYNEKNGFANVWTLRIYLDRNNAVWLGTNGGGVYQFSGDTFRYFDQSLGLRSSTVTSVTGDESGRLFVAELQYGTSSISGNHIVPSSLSEFSTQVKVVRAANNQIWVGSMDRGLAVFDNTQSHPKLIRQYTTANGLPSDWITVLQASGDKMWVGTTRGLASVSGNKVTLYETIDKRPIRIFCLYESEKEIYVGAFEGLYRLDNGLLTRVNLHPDVNTSSILSCVYNDDKLWLAVMGKGLRILDLKSKTVIAVDENDGLASNQVYSLASQGEGVCLAGTTQGLSRVSVAKGDYQIKNYRKENGFVGVEANHNATFRDKHGIEWFGTMGGLIGYKDQNNQLSDTITLFPFLQNVELLDRKMDVHDFGVSNSNWFSIPENLELKNDLNFLNLSMRAVNLVDPSQVYYKYKLENFDREWSQPTRDEVITYRGLPPGKYTFNFAASSDRVHWSPIIASYSFRILPPFYLTWWFIVLSLLIFMGCVYLFYYLQLQRKMKYFLALEEARTEEANKIRKRLAMDFHDELGNHLASLTSYSQILGMKLRHESESIRTLISKIEQNARNLLGGTKDFIWSIDPKSDSLTETLFYIKDFGEDLFDGSGLNFYFDFDPPAHQDYLPAWVNRQIVLIFKEGLSNALKHSQASNVRLSAELNHLSNHCHIILTDDGVGFSMNGKSSGMGLNHMQQRAKKIGAWIHISDNQPKGTKIALSVTIKNPNPTVNGMNHIDLIDEDVEEATQD